MFDPWTVAVITLKTCLLLVAAGAAVLLLARRSAAWRHLLWAAALVLSLLVPLAVMFPPSLSIKLTLPWQDMLPPPAATTRTSAAAPRQSDEPATTALARAPDATPATPHRNPRDAWPAVLTIWLVGALLVAVRNLLAHAALARWARTAQPALSPAWAATLRRLPREAHPRRRLCLLESDRTNSACTWGFLRPVILLPAVGAAWPEPQRRFALLHELAHVRRFDYLTSQLAALACALHWFNPLVWLAAAQARKLQEQACDDAVLNAGETPHDYAQFLVNIARGQVPLSLALSPAVGMAQRSQLHDRVAAILDASRARLPLTGLTLVAAAVPLACLMLFIATLSAEAAPGAPDARDAHPGIPLTGSFRAVELRNGGRVTLVHGESQRVRLLRGDPAQSLVEVDGEGRLVVDHCKAEPCTHVHDFEVEVTTPALAMIAVREGGIIRTGDGFPQQSQVALAVSQGGIVDVRTLPVSSVTASVYSGGRIFSRPATSLVADVEQGGQVMYWGDPVVRESIRNGGVVQRGTAADFRKSIAELDPPRLPPLPPIPPVAAVPPEKGTVTFSKR